MAADNSTATYKDIPGWPGYRVGDDGSIWYAWRTCRSGRKLTYRWKLMKQGVHKKRTAGRSYRYVNLTPIEGGSYKTFRVHRLVLETFVGPCPEGMECRHLDGNPSNNLLDNLAWGTREENIEDNRQNGAYFSTSRARMYTHDGQTLCLKDWAKQLSVSYSCLWHRINKLGMSFPEAIAAPFLGTAANGGRNKRLGRTSNSGNP